MDGLEESAREKIKKKNRSLYTLYNTRQTYLHVLCRGRMQMMCVHIIREIILNNGPAVYIYIQARWKMYPIGAAAVKQWVTGLWKESCDIFCLRAAAAELYDLPASNPYFERSEKKIKSSRARSREKFAMASAQYNNIIILPIQYIVMSYNIMYIYRDWQLVSFVGILYRAKPPLTRTPLDRERFFFFFLFRNDDDVYSHLNTSQDTLE